MRKSVLVTDGEQRAALAVVRSLGRAGYDVYACSTRARSIAGASRYCTGSYRVADALSAPDQFLPDVLAVAAATKADVLLPVTEAALLAILPNRERFNCVIPFASARSFESISDKSMVLNAAPTHGIAVPAQVEIAAAGDSPPLNEDARFPLVLKPSRSVSGNRGKRIRAGVRYAANESDLRQALSTMPGDAYPVLVQQRINGPGFAISVLVWDGNLVGAFAHRRIREKPPSGGVSVLRESIPLDASLLSRSLALLVDFAWQGVAMVEYKLDAISGVPYLMEINGRLWGSLQLAIDAGVDFPRLLVELALGGNPASVTTYELRVRSRWEWGDVDHLIAAMSNPSQLSVSAGSPPPTRLSILGQFIRGFGQGNRAEIFRWSDAGPVLRETIDWFRRR